MTVETRYLAYVYDGWNGHQTSLLHAVAPLTPEQLRWRPADHLNSVGEVARHISLGRVTWFARMGAPGSAELVSQISAWEQDSDGNRDIVESAIPILEQATELVHWLEITWQIIENTLKSWDISDLARTYRHTWNGQSMPCRASGRFIASCLTTFIMGGNYRSCLACRGSKHLSWATSSVTLLYHPWQICPDSHLCPKYRAYFTLALSKRHLPRGGRTCRAHPRPEAWKTSTGTPLGAEWRTASGWASGASRSAASPARHR